MQIITFFWSSKQNRNRKLLCLAHICDTLWLSNHAYVRCDDFSCLGMITEQCTLCRLIASEMFHCELKRSIQIACFCHHLSLN